MPETNKVLLTQELNIQKADEYGHKIIKIEKRMTVSFITIV